MELIIEKFKANIWSFNRNIRSIQKRLLSNKKPFLCRIGLHKMRRGFGWSGTRRMDVCLKAGCSFSKWHKDKIGNQLLKETI